MRRSFALTPVFIAFVFAATSGHAQSAVLDLPRDSQHARVIQRVGITDITINYHRPLVKGRKVWGGLVPYDKVWRTGANGVTKITFDGDVTIEGQKLAAGSYGLFTIPGQSEWTVIQQSAAALLSLTTAAARRRRPPKPPTR